MATAPGHKFGQIIGDLLETAVRPPLAKVAKKHKLYLDWQHKRPARNNRKQVKWTDSKGNSHNLDYVLEDGGTDESIGRPKAFIEIAYRRYTKHSRNKAQEIQGAVTPLADTHSDDHPFLGAILAGDFTNTSISQLQSHGFGVLYFPFDSIVKAFATVGIDAYFDEATSDTAIASKIKLYDKLNKIKKEKFSTELRSLHTINIKSFCKQLELSFTRKISCIRVLPLHGSDFSASCVQEAVVFITKFDENTSSNIFVRYEIIVGYNNDDEIRGIFTTKTDALVFLAHYQ